MLTAFSSVIIGKTHKKAEETSQKQTHHHKTWEKEKETETEQCHRERDEGALFHYSTSREEFPGGGLDPAACALKEEP